MESIPTCEPFLSTDTVAADDYLTWFKAINKLYLLPPETLARLEAVTSSSNFPKLKVEMIFLELQGKTFIQEHGFEPSMILCKEIWPLVQHYRWEHFCVPLGKPYQVEKQGNEEGEDSEDEEVEKEEDEMEQDSQEEEDED
ncbi:hypothetical protein Goari_024342 [Gossypium aridum]|uniref:Uncharacterized protein n=1 Tax=Gossypium aridum TaxID=34290 RepID=A0A7J8X5U9_GOSAI|nr:hypothetical protein [Gossypium aridum]